MHILIEMTLSSLSLFFLLFFASLLLLFSPHPSILLFLLSINKILK
ncbi:unnamed protein product [Spirodela intermedia]|uniref:Uncharacterized protein n=1 Tax=Spirodela intermedia TaxID=51605 RepID=A0A7I8JR73_SPIIN|nr:unnamed protein product [Spirodela intermedia]CAA6672656.1 unnamed protein product [Spirodela intermedia]